MKKCVVFACPNKGVQLYRIDPGTEVWLCDDCINRAERLVQEDVQKQKELVRAS